MGMLLSKLFGMDIYSVEGDYKGKIYDLIINLETGKVETITTQPLKPKTKQEAKKILTDNSIPFNRVRSAKDIVVVGSSPNPAAIESQAKQAKTTQTPTRQPYSYNRPRYSR